MNDQPMRDLCDRYWANQCSPEEAQQVLDWLLTPEGQRYYEQKMSERIAEADEIGILEDDPTEVAVGDLIQIASERSRSSRPRLQRPWAVAAAAAGLLVVGVLAWIWLAPYLLQQRIETAYGQTETVYLPDGSQVVLNANSTLSMAKDWDDDQAREVWLEGEAFFSVVHTARDKKFTVYSGEIAVDVLGTEFSVSNWDHTPEVTLSSGRVALRSEASSATATLQPGEMAAYSTENKHFRVRTVDAKIRTAWKDQQLIFRRTPLGEVFRRLERTQGLRISTPGIEVDSLLFTATLPAHRPELVLKAAAKAFNLKISQQNKHVIIQPQ